MDAYLFPTKEFLALLGVCCVVVCIGFLIMGLSGQWAYPSKTEEDKKYNRRFNLIHIIGIIFGIVFLTISKLL